LNDREHDGMLSFFVLFFFACLFGVQPVWSNDTLSIPKGLHSPGPSVWEGTHFFSSFRGGCCVEGERMRGVLYVRNPWGKVDVYHITGQWNALDATFHAFHHSGHRAQGRLLSADTVRLDITTRNGKNFSVHATRVPGAELDETSCAPMKASTRAFPSVALAEAASALPRSRFHAGRMGMAPAETESAIPSAMINSRYRPPSCSIF
jgi:hypothetical protein